MCETINLTAEELAIREPKVHLVRVLAQIIRELVVDGSLLPVQGNSNEYDEQVPCGLSTSQTLLLDRLAKWSAYKNAGLAYCNTLHEQGFAENKTPYYLACPEKFVEVAQVLDQLCSDYRDEMGYLRSNPLDTPLFTALSYYAGTLATLSIQLIVALEEFKHNNESIKLANTENTFADVMEIVRRYQPIKNKGEKSES
jgi:hypothetical protein